MSESTTGNRTSENENVVIGLDDLCNEDRSRCGDYNERDLACSYHENDAFRQQCEEELDTSGAEETDIISYLDESADIKNACVGVLDVEGNLVAIDSSRFSLNESCSVLDDSVHESVPDNFGTNGLTNENSRNNLHNQQATKSVFHDTIDKKNHSDDHNSPLFSIENNNVDILSINSSVSLVEGREIKRSRSLSQSDDIHVDINSPFFQLLPNDSMHAVCSFLTPSDLVNFCCVSKATTRGIEPVIKRVRMHGFKCAVEVVSAWLRGEHSDARELAALYIKSGVPIYPPCGRHAYDTLTWRMSVEGREIEAKNSPEYEGNELLLGNATKNNVKLDRFFADRYVARSHGGYFNISLTYLEEKTLFWRHRNEGSFNETSNSTRTGMTEGSDVRNSSDRIFTYGPMGSQMTEKPHKNLPTIKIHKHLANRHLIGASSAEDESGVVHVSPISLSSNFFHTMEYEKFRVFSSSADISFDQYHEHQYQRILRENDADQRVSFNTIRPNYPHDPMYYPLPLQAPVVIPGSIFPSDGLPDVNIEVYDSWTRSDEGNLARIELFHKKLESMIGTSPSNAFTECLADFWDVFFPLTSGVHYFDKYTPVPRLSKMHDFLTKPCPKAIGIVQCEIERIRSSPTKRKGVKGRLFPSYEYRLFIRDRSSIQDRADTVLMTAKNKGRNYRGSTANTKRGVNNYFLYMASEKESRIHNASLYGFEVPDEVEDMGNCESVEMGRLQSNFIGTEFQIYSPTKDIRSRQSVFTASESENETDVEGDNSSIRRRALRRSKSMPVNRRRIRLKPVEDEKSEDEDDHSVSPSRAFTRNRSLKTLLNRRKNHRAIASVDDTPPPSPVLPLRCEVEDGSITYTANLLGNRPRIMDVCVPKVSDDGTIGEWQRYLHSCRSNGENNLMLNKFKQVLERMNIPENQTASEDDPDTGIPSDFGLLCLQNRPPWWNHELGAFVLNFGGRVQVASVKNFQLCHRDDQDHIMLQFGRIQGRHSFTMDFQYPLTAIQAFAIAISSLQSKISLG